MAHRLIQVSLLFCACILLAGPACASKPPGKAQLRGWIQVMKETPRGPFKRLRWFCNDGSILPPEPYACREHGGGVQHGEWTARVKKLRQQNYLIATLLADLWPESFYAAPNWPQQLKQILLEQYLIGVDDGWIYRQARYYRGARQVEDENWHGAALLRELVQRSELSRRDFLLLREAVRLLPHGRQHAPLTEMRQLALQVEQQDPSFTPLRIKLHGHPEFADAGRVRQAAERFAGDRQPYQRLAELIEQLTRPGQNPLAAALKLGLGGAEFKIPENESAVSAAIRFARSNQLLRQLRQQFWQLPDKARRLAWLEASLDLEHALYLSANQLLEQLPQASRRQRLAWIELGLDGLYGLGFLSQRQWQSQQQTIRQLLSEPLSLARYHRQLQQLARLSRWAEQQLRRQFGATVAHLRNLEPLVDSYFQQRLRGSPLLALVQMIDSLLLDAQQLRGAGQTLFGRPVTGLRPLNPGLARGRLELVSDPQRHSFRADGIYLLPETIAELPPVAGILTRNAGNGLSHIQLLARNLGIPNLAVPADLVEELRNHAGETIVLAVSPGGVVQIEADSPTWRRHFRQQAKRDFLIRTDLDKLDLTQRGILSLEQIRASDSGRIAGPKGANLGELKQLYRQLIPDALILPFGIFREQLDRERVANQSLFEWLQDSYRRLARIDDPQQRQRQTSAVLAKLRQRLENIHLPDEFREQLRRQLASHFGPDGSYGVFVRSDTNVEDLPNFTGAGLNRTIPHVVGFEAIVAAIRQVWASPFTERAFSWRQSHMEHPEHVYVSVLLMKSVPADKSGVLATADLVTGNPELLHVAVNEGVGGAVSGQQAEELLIDRNSGQVQLLAQASAETKRVLLPTGGASKVPAARPEQLLSEREIGILREMAHLLPAQFPALRNRDGTTKPADIEFGFLDGRFVLFQIRPLVESKRVKADLYLQHLDRQLVPGSRELDLSQIPNGVRR